ncbi:MAG: glucose-6-phosphate dehydrogenase [Candidatus Pacebacteria bacterium]|jgi:glucose-6-phosphate 1-dehydrogenase|nr:glucose-6-phosphate dehydrogenase [Candidatus Paceibacterota bacterium]
MNPTIFVIFGITGDLAQRKLLPSLLSLYVKKLLPEKFAIIGVSRRMLSREEFRQFVRDEINIKFGQYREEDVKHFLDHMSYVQGSFDTDDMYTRLAERLQSIDKQQFKTCSNKLFHLSVPPTLYENILDHLSNSGLTLPCGGDEGWTRVLIEKPFGNDSETAKKLDKKLGELFKEDQIFRIDHYLAKEALQNILVFRFANSLFEPIWNNKHIDKVHIKLFEKIDLEGRGAFYDNVGALRDVGQNHVLQMLALIAMEQPEVLDAEHIRKERAKILKNLQCEDIVRGQYSGYREEKGVADGSMTETYFRIEAHIDTGRWKKTPFFLESGKALDEAKTEIDIYFKNKTEEQNILTFRIQPDEGIKIRFWVKKPGLGMEIEAKPLKFKYSDFPSKESIPDAYEKVIYDAFVGDQTLFTSTDEVLAAWKFITPILKNWGDLPLERYPKGSRPE